MSLSSSSSSQKIWKSKFEFEFFLFNFSSSVKKTKLIEFEFAAVVKIKVFKPEAKILKNSFMTKTGFKTHVAAKYCLLMSFQNHSINKLELDKCFFEFKNPYFSSSSLAKQTSSSIPSLQSCLQLIGYLYRYVRLIFI